MTDTYAELKARMTEAGFPIRYMSLAHARFIMSGEHDGLWCENASDTRSYVSEPYVRAQVTYYADAAITFFLLGDIASNCEYSSASTYDASNLRSLLRDYPDRVFKYSYTNGDIGAVLLASLDDDLTDILTGLKEQYPIYDEEDHMLYEMELAEAAWDQWLHSDVRQALHDSFNVDEIDWEEVISDDTLRELFYGNGYDGDTENDGLVYHGEGGAPDSVIFPEQDEVIARIAAIVRERWEASRLAKYAAQCDGQTEIGV